MKKRVPRYWWDFKDNVNQPRKQDIVVESDDDRFPIIKKYRFDDEKGIEKAEELIDKLIGGRANPRKLAKKL
jgi:hypothetical protein